MNVRKTEYAMQEQNFVVPADMVMDVLQVVFNYGVRYQIHAVNSEDGYLKLTVASNGQSPHYGKAVKNIEVLLDEYKDFERSGEFR